MSKITFFYGFPYAGWSVTSLELIYKTCSYDQPGAAETSFDILCLVYELLRIVSKPKFNYNLNSTIIRG